MALTKQRAPISFTQGLDTKSDEKQVLPGKLLELENGVFTSPGQIQKRNGLTSWTTRVEGNDRFVSGSALETYRDELLQFTGAELYSWLPSVEKWSLKGPASSVITRTDKLVTNGYTQSNPDVALMNGVAVYAWEDSRGGVRYSAFDTETGARIVEDKLVSSSGTAPKCTSTSGELRVYFIDGSSLKYRAIAPASPSAIATEETAVVDVYSTGSIGPVSIFSDASENVWTAFVTGSAGNGLAVSVQTYALTTLLSASVIDSDPGTIRNITGFCATGSQANVYYEVTGTYLLNVTQSYNQHVKVVAINTAGTASTPTVWKRSVGLASVAWQHDSSYFLNTIHDSPLQATYFTFGSQGNSVSKANPSNSGPLRASGSLSKVPALSNGVFVWANGSKGKVISEGESLFSNVGLASTTLDFTTGNRYFASTLADNLHVIGGTLGCYDGSTFAEHNFHLYPEFVSGSASTSGGSMEAGTRQYLATYEWPDASDQMHRSATSVPVSVVTSGTTSKVTLTVPSLRLTNKEGVQVAIYRTEVDGDVFYKTTSRTAPVFNTGSADTVTYVDTLSDDDLIAREILYTTGDILDNFAAPPGDLTITCKGRVWVGGLEDGNTLAYSKLAKVGDPVAFHPNLTVKIEARDGRVKALGDLDGTLVVFKRSSVYVVSGDGFNNAGAGFDFAVNRITTDVGCSNPNSVVVVADKGLMFQSDKGIYLLDRGFNARYIGAPVEAYNDLTITSATLVADSNQVRFTTSTSVGLIYDYFNDQWSTFTNYTAVDSTVWGDTFVLLRSSGVVAEETPGTFTDSGSHIKLKLVTGWLQLAGLQGYQRVYRLNVLGDYKGPHKLNVQVGYDYNTSFASSALIDAESVMGLTTYGADSPYGSGTPYGGSFPLYEFDIQLSKQKCTSLRVSIEDQQSSAYNEGLSLSSLSLTYGVKQGGAKLGSSRRFGTT